MLLIEEWLYRKTQIISHVDTAHGGVCQYHPEVFTIRLLDLRQFENEGGLISNFHLAATKVISTLTIVI